MTRVVNGVTVELSPEEEAAQEAEWAANPPLTTQQMLEALRTRAAARLSQQEAETEMLIRAVVLTTLDEVNVLRSWLASFKTEVAAASSLADLKTRVAGLPGMGPRTAQQVRTAIGNKIEAGDADT